MPLFGGIGIYSQLTEFDYLHPILGYVCAPIIGRYGNAGYQLGKVHMVMDYPVRIIGNDFFCATQRINLPKRVWEVMSNIPELIPHNKPPKKQQPKVSEKKMGKKQ